MKPLAILLNLAMVVIAIVVYDQVRDDSAPTAQPVKGESAEIEALERRVRRLETEPPPAPLTDPTELRASPDAPNDAESQPDEMEAIPRDLPSAAPAASSDEVTEEEIRRFQRLQEAVRREASVARNKARVEATLNKLSISLTDEQRARIHTTVAAFEPREKQIWSEARSSANKTKAEGGQINRGELVAKGMTAIQTELAAQLAGIVHQADAQAIAEALKPKR